MSQLSRLATLLAAFFIGTLALPTQVHAETPPAWTLKNLAGKSVSLSDFKGKVIVLNLWAPWCPPCRAEIPSFIELQTQYKAKGVTFIGMAVSAPEADVAAYVKDHGLNYPIVLGDDNTAMAYGASEGIPVTVVIDGKGNIIAHHLGEMDKATIDGDIQKALGK